MQLTSKGQVTIPLEIRMRLGLLPHTEVEFEVAKDHAIIRKALKPDAPGKRGKMLIDALWGKADTGMTTAEIMALTRGEPRAGKKRKR